MTALRTTFAVPAGGLDVRAKAHCAGGFAIWRGKLMFSGKAMSTATAVGTNHDPTSYRLLTTTSQ